MKSDEKLVAPQPSAGGVHPSIWVPLLIGIVLSILYLSGGR